MTRKGTGEQSISFNSRPLKEVDVISRAAILPVVNFQFTTSQGGRPSGYSPLIKAIQNFQFTTSQGGRRHCFCVFCYRFNSFNSRPLKEVDPTGSGKNYTLEPFNSRPLKEVDTIDIVHNPNRLDFQFTTSQGGRQYSIVDFWCFVFFQFTTSQGGRRLKTAR